MGLAGPKRKQRLVGAAVGRNEAWLGDTSLPGQRLLAKMGWTAGQGLGSFSQGRSEAVKAMYKIDNKGIGSQRAEKEAREKGQTGLGMERWIGGSGNLGALFERLNASASSSSARLTLTKATTASRNDVAADFTDSGPSRKDSKSRNDRKDKKRKRESAQPDRDEAEAFASADSEGGDAASNKRCKRANQARKEKNQYKEKTQEAKREKKRVEEEANKLVKELKKAGKAKESKQAEEVVETLTAVPASSGPLVVRNASRARFLRAKRQLHGDLVSLNEILGISPSLSLASASPAPKLPEPEAESHPETVPSQSVEEDQSSKQGFKSKKLAKKAAKKAAKAATAKNSAANAQPIAKDPERLVLNPVSSLSVHEHLSRRLMLRKAEVIKAKKADQDAVWGRLNSSPTVVGGMAVMVE